MSDKIDNEAMAEKAYELGFLYEQKYRGCAQCAIAAIQDALGIQNDLVYKTASGLAGGVGECTDGVCGGYSGAVMMMSLFFGRTRAEEGSVKGRADKYDSFHMASAMHDTYVGKYGSVICKEIHKAIFGRSFDLRNDDDKQAFRDAGAHEKDDKCCAVVGDGARWAVKAILEELERRNLTLEDFRSLVQRDQQEA
ncbi:MAG: C_GCAxxG_C_C family protein [Sphaerochaeta sp.]|nr:C_GCAxxG_C_C family protein [Sphaerochaeta sp.]